MSRIASSAARAATAATNLMCADLIRLSFGCTDATYTDQATCELNAGIWTPDILMTDFSTDVSADVDGTGAIVFQTTSDLLELSAVDESLGMEITSVSIGLSAISNTWLQQSQTIELLNRPVEIWRAIIDPTTFAIVGSPFKYFAGVVVAGDILKTEGGDGSSVQLECSNEFYNFEIVSGFRCNELDHQKFFPNDTGFKNTSSIQKKVMWGEES
jgi:hypothetical protein